MQIRSYPSFLIAIGVMTAFGAIKKADVLRLFSRAKDRGR
jgi:hypothetical protein